MESERTCQQRSTSLLVELRFAEGFVVVPRRESDLSSEIEETSPFSCLNERPQRFTDEGALGLDPRKPGRLLHQIVVQYNVGPHTLLLTLKDTPVRGNIKTFVGLGGGRIGGLHC